MLLLVVCVSHVEKNHTRLILFAVDKLNCLVVLLDGDVTMEGVVANSRWHDPACNFNRRLSVWLSQQIQRRVDIVVLSLMRECRLPAFLQARGFQQLPKSDQNISIQKPAMGVSAALQDIGCVRCQFSLERKHTATFCFRVANEGKTDLGRVSTIKGVI